jgi:broad specificity phosphatase PhoE
MFVLSAPIGSRATRVWLGLLAWLAACVRACLPLYLAAQVLLVRHGETDWNLAKRLQGQVDTELSALGLEQARECGRYLRHAYPRGFVAAVSSDLQRALRTAREIVGEDVRADARLRETALGAFQGRTASELLHDPELREPWLRFLADPGCAASGGESRLDQRRRAEAALAELVLEAAAAPAPPAGGRRTALLVAHGGTMDQLYRCVTRVGEEARVPHSGNCAIAVVHAQVEMGALLHWEVKRWNEQGHLTEHSNSQTL